MQQGVSIGSHEMVWFRRRGLKGLEGQNQLGSAVTAQRDECDRVVPDVRSEEHCSTSRSWAWL